MRSDLRILVVDDDRIDTEMILRAFAQSQLVHDIQCVRSGIEALERLRGQGELEPLGDERLPSLILLDLNMPRMNGLELLAELKADPELRRIPVVVLTTSNDELELERCYALGAAGCIVKPIDFSAFVEGVRRVAHYWALCETPRLRRRTARS